MAEVLKENEDLKKAANKHDDELAKMDFKQNEMRVKLLSVHSAHNTVHCTLQNIHKKSTNLSFLYCHICQNGCREAFPSEINKKKKMC